MVERFSRPVQSPQSVREALRALGLINYALQEAAHNQVVECSADGDKSWRLANDFYNDNPAVKRAVYESIVIARLRHFIPSVTNRNTMPRILDSLKKDDSSVHATRQVRLLRSAGREALQRVGVVMPVSKHTLRLKPAVAEALALYRDSDYEPSKAGDVSFPQRTRAIARYDSSGKLNLDERSVYAAVKYDYPPMEVPGAVYLDAWWKELHTDLAAVSIDRSINHKNR